MFLDSAALTQKEGEIGRICELERVALFGAMEQIDWRLIHASLSDDP